MSRKKLCFIIAGLIILAVVIIAAILLSKNKMPSLEKIPAEKVNSIRALDPTLTPDNKSMVYYDLDQLDLYKLNLSSNTMEKLSDNMDQPLKIIWSPDRSQAIIKIIYDKYKFEKFGSPFVNTQLQDETVALWHYDSLTQKYTMLDTNIFNPAPLDPLNPIWTADSKHLIYHHLDRNNNVSTLNISDGDGQNWRKLGDVPENLYSILSYDDSSNTVLYSTYSTETNFYRIARFNITKQQDEEIITDAGLSLLVDDNQMVCTKNNRTFFLNLLDKKQKNLPVIADEGKTFLSADGKKLIAVKNKEDKEYILIVNLENFKIEKNIDPGLDNSNIKNLTISSDGQNIFFTNDDLLYKIDLKR